MVNVDGLSEKSPTMLPMTVETFYNVIGTQVPAAQRAKAFMLYAFYCIEALRQDSSQPLATDEFCSSCLRQDLKATRSARKLLMEMGLIEHVEKKVKGYRYIRVHFLPVKLSNQNGWQLSAEVPDFDTIYPAVWWERWLRKLQSNVPLLQRRIEVKAKQKRYSFKLKASPQEILELTEEIFERFKSSSTFLACERDFVFYMVDSMVNEFEKTRFG